MPILNRCIVCSATVFLPMLTFSEEVLLLLLDEREGIFLSVGKNTLELAMAGAVLMELAFAGRIDTDLAQVYQSESIFWPRRAFCDGACSATH